MSFAPTHRLYFVEEDDEPVEVMLMLPRGRRAVEIAPAYVAGEDRSGPSVYVRRDGEWRRDGAPFVCRAEALYTVTHRAYFWAAWCPATFAELKGVAALFGESIRDDFGLIQITAGEAWVTFAEPAKGDDVKPAWAHDLIASAERVRDDAASLNARVEEMLRELRHEMRAGAVTKRELGDALDELDGSRATIAVLEAELKSARAALTAAGVPIP